MPQAGPYRSAASTCRLPDIKKLARISALQCGKSHIYSLDAAEATLTSMGNMLKVLIGERGRSAFVAVLALSAFLICLLPSHHAQAYTTTASAATSTSTAGPYSALQPGDSASAPDTPTANGGTERQSSDDHGHYHDPAPACHATSAHLMDTAKPPIQGSVLGLLGALLIVPARVARNNARAPGWATRPSRLLAGFPLLITLGVSRT